MSEEHPPDAWPSRDREFTARRDAIRSEMGGRDRIEALHRAGASTARERIDALADGGTFREIGTFAASAQPQDRAATPADGRITGFASVAGRPVGIVADDATVKGASAAPVNIRKADKIYEQSLRAGHPLIYLGETRGSRIPDSMGSAGLSTVSGEGVAWARRRRRIPMATVITGLSFGGSSFFAAMSDLVVQVRGTCLAITSPAVIESATGEQTDFEALGGTAVHERVTGQIDLAADDEATALALVRQWLGYLPASQDAPPPRAAAAPPPGRRPLHDIVPARRQRGYDIRDLLAELVDAGQFLELKPMFGRGLVTALARIDGRPVGVFASNPRYLAGSLDPDACDKGTRLLCLCDAFGLPVVFLHDSPGFLVGTTVEHRRALSKCVLFLEALALSSVPRISVIIRKSYGLAYTSLGGAGTDSDLLLAWPGAEIGFMDPDVAARALHGRELAGLDGPQRAARAGELAADLQRSDSVWGAAAAMAVDEVIRPEETRDRLAAELGRLAGRPLPGPSSRPLSGWPTCW
jgi:acetyl-CoA carboxylase carboxyltransferase component